MAAPAPRTRDRDHVAFQRIVLLGSGLRLMLFFFPALCKTLSERPEISTPAASWKRLHEGIYLFERGLDPYDGDMFQQSPLLLALFAFVPIESHLAVSTVYTLADALVAGLLYQLARVRSSSTESQVVPWHVSAVYLLHPFTILSCLGRCPTVFPSLMTVSSILLAARGQGPAAAVNLALAGCLSMYPCLLLPPLVLLANQSKRQKTFATVGAFVLSFIALTLLCRFIVGSWSFARAVRSLLSVSDLTPNVGLSWYLFIEMFDHFRTFFIGVFHLHVISYVAPLSIKLSHAPQYAITILLGIIATFKSYPTVVDVSLFHALLSLYPELFPYMRHRLFSIGVLFYSACLLPAFHHLWLYAGSGNANFYYASTLVWGIGNGALVIDALYAHLKRDFLASQGYPEGDIVVIQE